MEPIKKAFYGELKKGRRGGGGGGGGGDSTRNIEHFLHLADSLNSSSTVFIYCNVTITKSYWYTYDM